jgi:hypothetical protein
MAVPSMLPQKNMGVPISVPLAAIIPAESTGDFATAVFDLRVKPLTNIFVWAMPVQATVKYRDKCNINFVTVLEKSK